MTKLILSLSLTLSLFLPGRSQAGVASVTGSSTSAASLADLTNAFNALSALSNNAALNADAFVFAGDSFIGEVGLSSGVGYGLEWPTLLLTTTNYARYLYTYNFGVAGTTTADASNTYATTVGLVKPASGSKAYLFLQSGQNLETVGQTMTNFWTNLMMRARADGYTVVAFTSATQAYSGATQLIHNTNNLMIRARSDLYDYLVDFDQLVTNAAVQIAVNGHPTAAFNRNLADYIGRTIVPTHSGVYQRIMPSRILNVDLANVNSNINARGGVNVTGGAVYQSGPAITFSWDATSVLGLVTSSDGIGSYLPLWLRGTDIKIPVGSLTVPVGPLTLGANGASLTNFYATNSVLDFASTGGGTNTDMVITVPGGCTTNDLVLLQAPATVQLPTLTWSAFTSNNTIYTRCMNNRTNGTAVDPPAAMFNWLIFKR